MIELGNNNISVSWADMSLSAWRGMMIIIFFLEVACGDSRDRSDDDEKKNSQTGGQQTTRYEHLSLTRCQGTRVAPEPR